jgi:DNA-directed RNA polymerase specialized sigma subunit
MKAKSKNYQYKIVEVSFDQLKLNNFSEDKGIAGILTDNSYSEDMLDLREKLLEEIYCVVNSDFLTEHQKKVLFMILMGKTQNEIAEHLGITQSAVHKALRGNLDYKNDKKRYGGIFKKLKKICKNNEKIQLILDEMNKLKDKVD